MKLKIEPEKIEDGKVFFDFSKGYRTKIFARTLPCLLGENQYQSRGWGILKTMCLLEKEEIDPYYTIRGSISEYFAYLYMSRIYDSYNLKDYKWSFYDNIKFDAYEKNRFFAGKPDFKLSTENMSIIHEVKSKGYDKFDNFTEDLSEVRQGQLYCVLEETKKLVMVYVFPNSKVEKKLRQWLNNSINKVEEFNPRNVNDISIDDFKFIIKNHTVNIDEVKQQLNQAYKTVNECVKQGYIPTNWFNEKDVNELGLLPF